MARQNKTQRVLESGNTELLICLYCGLPIDKPRANKLYHNDLCKAAHHYYKDRLEESVIIFENLYKSEWIDNSVLNFIRTLNAPAKMKILESMGFKWRGGHWLKSGE